MSKSAAEFEGEKGVAQRWSVLFLLPVITCALFPITFSATLGISIYTNHTNIIDFPYISETGAKPPESCLFGQLLNIAAVVAGLTAYVRYRQTVECFDRYLTPAMMKTNMAALVLGEIAAFGVSMVGNFQTTNIIVAHYIGAALAFVGGTVYAWLECWISYKMLKISCSRRMLAFRISISLLTTVFLILTLVGGYIFQNTKSQTYRLLSTGSEWVMAFGLAIIFISFSKEFARTKIRVRPHISVIQLTTMSEQRTTAQ